MVTMTKKENWANSDNIMKKKSKTDKDLLKIII